MTAAPAVYFDVGARAGHAHRGIARYIDGLLEGFAAEGALGREVTTDPAQAADVPVVHLPAPGARRVANPRQVVVRTAYDLTPLRHPLLTFRPWQLARFARYVRDLGAMRRSDHVVAISQATARDAARLLRIAQERVTVIAPGVAHHFAGVDGHGGRGELAAVLYVGAASRHKNVRRLVLAHAQVRHPCRLVLIGPVTERQRARLERLAGRLGTADRLTVRGTVPDTELRDAYARSAVLVQPSRWEGFGLTVLEAMASGTPVVSSNTSSLPEVVGSCGLLVDPRSVRQIAAAVDAVLGDPALGARLSSCGRERAKAFSWQAAAAAHLDLYRTLSTRP